jgi:simple sugar transport system ATP-binding protein
MVHQHTALVPRFTVLENLALGQRGARRGFALPLASVEGRARALAEATGLDVPLGRAVEELGVGDRQRAEILKVLLREPGVLILDEPTAVLSPPEVERLLALLRDLAAGGRAVLLVAHKLDEVLAVADRVTVLRRGRTVLEATREEVDAERLARAMVGGSSLEGLGPVGVGEPALGGPGGPQRPRPGAAVVALHDVDVVGPHGETVLDGVNLEVRWGEIVGVAGVEGNGQRQLARVAAARQRPHRGRVDAPPDPAFVPQDRRQEGLIAAFSLQENVALALHRDPRFRRGPRGALLDWPALGRRTRELLTEFAIEAPGPATRAGDLSGGNQQRLVVARELARDALLLVAENPTRGLDVAATVEVHKRLRALPGRPGGGGGVLLVSTDLDEVLALADRVLVLVRGRLYDVPEAERTREGIGRRMLSGKGPGP